MQNPIADIVENQYSVELKSRVPFAELCGFYAALQWKASLATVAQASGLDVSSIAHLKAAGERRGGQIRYPKVRAEFKSLGLEKFSTTYLTSAIRDRLRLAADQVNTARNAKSPFEIAGVQPRANKDRGRHAIKDPTGGPDTPIEIKFDRGPKPGWKWRQLEPEADDPIAAMWRGDPRREERGFPTSTAAKLICQARFGPSDEDYESGRFDHAIDDEYLFDIELKKGARP